MKIAGLLNVAFPFSPLMPGLKMAEVLSFHCKGGSATFVACGQSAAVKSSRHQFGLAREQSN
jgi:hypothetical protein